jgi:hypothetical protein
MTKVEAKGYVPQLTMSLSVLQVKMTGLPQT